MSLTKENTLSSTILISFKYTTSMLFRFNLSETETTNLLVRIFVASACGNVYVAVHTLVYVICSKLMRVAQASASLARYCELGK